MSEGEQLQFDKAEYTDAAAVCPVCSEPIRGAYFLLGARKVCARCKHALVATFGRPIGVAGYVKGLAAGVAAGLLCAIGWGLIRTLTGYELGLIAIAVGWAVAEAMRRGAGRGTRALQVAAVLIAYLAIIASYVPELAGEIGGDGGTLHTVIAWIVAVPTALVLPFLMWQGGVSSIIWYFLVFIALRRAWTGLTPPHLEFVGPVGG
jgi:hypothetical protein